MSDSELPAIPVSKLLAQHVAGHRYADLPATTVSATKRALLDAIGVMTAASGLSPEARPFRERAEADGGTPEARLIGSTIRVPAAAAALANGALGHALDFGDTFDAGPAHPNAALVAALLALADADPAIDAERFVTAMAVGSDLCCRLSLSPGRPLEVGGWYPPPILGAIGAAAGCASLLGLDAEATCAAIGLAMCQATFPAEIKYDGATHLRAIREGFAAYAAVSGARLARAGVRGFEAPLEGKGGFFAIYAGGSFDAAALLDGLGERYLGDEVSFKPWPSCRGTHAYIEAGLRLRETIDWRRIESIEVEIGPVQQMLVAPIERKAAPATAIDAKFSIPFTLATALVRGAVTLDSFGPEALADAEVLAVARLVRPVLNPAWGRAEAASGGVTVHGAGRDETLRILTGKGHPSRPIADADLIDKFVDCVVRGDRPVTREAARKRAERLLGQTPAQAAGAWTGD